MWQTHGQVCIRFRKTAAGNTDRNRIGCLPERDDGRLVGIVTSYDFLDASARLFKEQLTRTSESKSVKGTPEAPKALSAGAGNDH